jgi:putative flippase GtrA
MMIEMFKHTSSFFKKGTLQRFGIAGGFNTLIFLVLMEFFYFMFPESFAAIIWATSWIISSFLAHFVHRYFTFETDEPMKKTIPLVALLYVVGMLGSTWTYMFFLGTLSIHIRYIALGNVLLWGAITWMSMRIFIFKHTHAVKSHRIQAVEEV